MTLPIDNVVYKLELDGPLDTDILRAALGFCRTNHAALGLTGESDLGSLCVEPIAKHIATQVPAPKEVASPTETETAAVESEGVADATPEAAEVATSLMRFEPLVLVVENASESDNLTVSIECLQLSSFSFFVISFSKIICIA